MSRAIADHPLPRVAAIYRRVSSLKQSAEDKYSLETQEDAARAWCATNGWTPGEVYTDVHSAEDLWQRPELMRLLADVGAGKYGLVLAHAVDRLSREQTGAHLAIIAEQVERAGAVLECVTEHLDSTPQGAMIRTFKAFAAGIENEKRVERTQRIIRKRAEDGKYVAGDQAPYGYAFAPQTDSKGRLTKERLIEHPVTATIVRRIFQETASGKSGRRLAYDLTQDRIPTPDGRPTGGDAEHRWEPGSIRYLLRQSIYWGEPRALRSVTVPVPAHLRATPTRPHGPNGERLYKHKTREIPRDVDAQIALPATVAPALVSRELAYAVKARMQWNREHAAALLASAPDKGDFQALLTGGFAVCGGCGGAISVRHQVRDGRTSRPGTLRHRYICRRLSTSKGACTQRSIECRVLDGKVWHAITRLLQNERAWIEQEVERLRAQPDPGTSTLEGIDRQIAELDQRIERKRKYAEAVDDARERAAVAAEVGELWRQRDGLSATRQAAHLHYASLSAQRDGLAQTLDWCAVVGANMPTADYETRRMILMALHVQVYLYRSDEIPRARMTLTLPLAGVRDIPLDLLAAPAPTAAAAETPSLPRDAQLEHVGVRHYQSTGS